MNQHNFKHITTNSKKVKEGSVFVSINNNPLYIKEAIENKAFLIVSDIKLDIDKPNLIVKNIEYFFSYWYQKLNEINMLEFKTICVTGTDGKTTVCKMIYDTIKERYNAIYLGTLGIYYDDKIIDTKNTTPDIETILETYKLAKSKNIKYMILETSSEGLLAKRLSGIKVDVIVFTNLSWEHLNTHKTMDSYFNSKKLLLKLLKPSGVVISNCEDSYGILYKGNYNINYGLHKGKIHTLSFFFFEDETLIYLINNYKLFSYKIPFIGVYNIYNFLAAHAVINELFNINLFKFNNLKPPKGRFLVINKNIIIDFAHTPNALENLLLTVKEKCGNKKLILLLGAQGGKDKSKRKLLGDIASKYCDIIILTSEDPKNECIIDILLDISLGILKSIYIIEINRKNAIKKGLKLLNDDSLLLIVGKGMEEYEIHNNAVYKHSDYECVLNESQA